MIYDFVIVGGGPGGYTAALRAAALGKKVALVEKEHLGGVCLNWGCIPTKALLKSSKVYDQMKKAAGYGISCSGLEVDMPKVVSRKNNVVSQLRKGLDRLLAQDRIDIFKGQAKLLGEGKVAVAGVEADRYLEARFIILATGADIAEIPGLACDGQYVLNIRSALDLCEIPERLVVIGAGVVGCEMAQFFSTLGSQVSLVDIMSSPMAGLDHDLEKLLLRSFKKRKYRLHLGRSVDSLAQRDSAVHIRLDSGEEIQADRVLVTAGMKPVSKGLGLEQAGVEVSRSGHIKVDDHCRTSQDGIYAVGDVTGLQPLAHFAAHMGMISVRHALGDQSAVIDQEAVPKAVFLDPELAWVGLSEAQARERHKAVVTGKFLVRGLGRAAAEGSLDGVVKLVARADDRVLLGAHAMGPHASTLIGEATLALAKGLTLHDLAETIHAHPTYGEAIMEAADAALSEFLLEA